MSTTIEGVYHNGKIELSETPKDVCEGTRAVVTFLPPGAVDLREHGIDKVRAAELRARLACFAEDWESLKWISMTTMMRKKLNYKRGSVL